MIKKTAWTEGVGLGRILEWVRFGLTDEQVAKNIGIAKKTLYEWLKKDPDFASVYRDAKVQPNIELENAMFKLACGQMFIEETKTILDAKDGSVVRIEKTRKQIPPSAVLLIFLAKNRMRDKYKDYAPVPIETEKNDEKPEVKIYLPDNERDAQ